MVSEQTWVSPGSLIAHLAPLGCGHATECGSAEWIELPGLLNNTFVPRSASLACGYLLCCATSRRARSLSEHSKLLQLYCARCGLLFACIAGSNGMARLTCSSIRHIRCTLHSLVHLVTSTIVTTNVLRHADLTEQASTIQM